MRLRTVLAPALLAAAAFPQGAGAAEQPLGQALERALERGVGDLLATQQRDGSWASGQPNYVAGQTALSLYALLKCGLAPEEPALARGFRFLDAHPPYDTYGAGLAAMAYEAAHDPRRFERIAALAERLLANQRRGLWSYPTTWERGRFTANLGGLDLSNTQYAVLGLRAAAAAGVEVPAKAWLDLCEGALRLQEPPVTVDVAPRAGETGTGKLSIAGFRYNDDTPVRGSMTTAGVSALAIARAALRSELAGAQRAEVETALQRGVAWLGHHFRADAHPAGEEAWLFYWLYGVERVGSLLELETLGDHDWYLEGARFLVARQAPEGYWAGNAGLPVRPRETDTCWALLFLQRATALVPATRGLDAGRAPSAPASDDDVRLAYAGRGAFEAWIAGFSDRVLAEHGGGELGGLRVAYVEYTSGEQVLAHVDGDPSRAWTDERYRGRFELARPGVYPLVARVYLVAPIAAVDETRPTRMVASAPREVRSRGTSAPWMDELVARRAENQLAGKERKLVASSIHAGDAPAWAFDGLEGTRWMCAKDDAAPTLIVEFQKPATASELRLYTHCASPHLVGLHDVVRRVSVRVNRSKGLLQATAPDDELAPIVVPLGRSTTVQRLEIRILERTPGKTWPGHAGFTEVELYR